MNRWHNDYIALTLCLLSLAAMGSCRKPESSTGRVSRARRPPAATDRTRRAEPRWSASPDDSVATIRGDEASIRRVQRVLWEANAPPLLLSEGLACEVYVRPQDHNRAVDILAGDARRHGYWIRLYPWPKQKPPQHERPRGPERRGTRGSGHSPA
jgi:hypothetical protein